MANTYDAALFVCRTTTWTVQPIATTRPIVTKKGTFVQWWCSACDTEGRPRGHADYNPARPAVHVKVVEPIGEQEDWRSRWTAKKVPA